MFRVCAGDVVRFGLNETEETEFDPVFLDDVIGCDAIQLTLGGVYVCANNRKSCIVYSCPKNFLSEIELMISQRAYCVSQFIHQRDNR